MVVILVISSWRGISIGAIHYYAKLMWDDASKRENGCAGLMSVDLERTLTAVEVKAENAQLQSNGHRPCFRVGDTTHGFETEADAVAAGIKYFKENFNQAHSVLYKGEYASCSAWQDILVWPNTRECDMIAKSMTKLAKEFQALNGYECKKDKEAHVERIDARWYKRYQKMNDLCKNK